MVIIARILEKKCVSNAVCVHSEMVDRQLFLIEFGVVGYAFEIATCLEVSWYQNIRKVIAVYIYIYNIYGFVR